LHTKSTESVVVRKKAGISGKKTSNETFLPGQWGERRFDEH
jgi:hypothetical protein